MRAELGESFGADVRPRPLHPHPHQTLVEWLGATEQQLGSHELFEESEEFLELLRLGLAFL